MKRKADRSEDLQHSEPRVVENQHSEPRVRRQTVFKLVRITADDGRQEWRFYASQSDVRIALVNIIRSMPKYYLHVCADGGQMVLGIRPSEEVPIGEYIKHLFNESPSFGE